MKRMVLAILALTFVCSVALRAQSRNGNPVVALLQQGKAVFGSMVSDKSEAAGARMAQDGNLDFVFYDMERTYDLPAMKAFLKGLSSTPNRKALLVRIPPIGTEPEKAEVRVAEILEAGADGVVFPHIMNRKQVDLAVQWLGKSRRGVWPLHPAGEIVGYFMIEDRESVEQAKDIVSAKGATMFAPGQGSLGQAYGGDAKAVETAVQAILSSCKEFKAVCAKLATDADIEKRVTEGFRVLLASGDALLKGRKLAGR